METAPPHKPGRYLAIQVAGKYYAIPNERVREIMPVQELFPPHLASSEGRGGTAGFLHTQNARVPVFDLHVRLGGAPRDIRLSPYTRIIVVEVHGSNLVGIYADRLTDMIQAWAHEIRRDSIIGHGRPKTILNIDRLWALQDLAALA